VRSWFLIAIAAASLYAADVYRLPPLDPSYDAVAVFLPAGGLPQIPWEGFPDDARERFWALSCSGMLAQKSAWSAYLMVTPPGAADQFIPAAEMLQTSFMMPDTSVWTRALSLAALDTTGPVIVVWAASDSYSAPAALPLRTSLWLSEGPDTLVISGSWDNNLFLWFPGSSAEGTADASWRGRGTELIPASGRSYMVAVSTEAAGTPAGLAGLLASGHSWDSTFATPWGEVFAGIDSLVETAYPESSLAGGLIWLRGTGSSRGIQPWQLFPGPSAPARARVVIPWGDVPPPAPPSGRPPDVAGVSRFSLPCVGEGPERLAVLACILERVLARSALPWIPGARAIQVYPAEDSLEVILTGQIGIPESLLPDTIRSLVSATALCPPESALVVNATLRASIREGRWLPMPEMADIVLNLGEALGLAGAEVF
jgi:hypothetical protein